VLLVSESEALMKIGRVSVGAMYVGLKHRITTHLSNSDVIKSHTEHFHWVGVENPQNK